MTTEQPRAERRLLRRTTDDRVIGGVASGLGDYLNIDPLLIRIGFVGLMVFGGLGLILYLAGWILIPEDTESDSIGGQLLDRTGLTTERFLIGALVAVGIFIVLWGVSPRYGDDNVLTALVVGVVVIVVGTLVLRQNAPAPAAATPTADPAAAATAPMTNAPAAPRQRVAKLRRPPSPLGGYVLGATLAAVGLLALIANATTAEVRIGQYFGLALGAIGLGLVVGTWWGHARALILLGLVLMPFAIAASLITVPLQGGFGSHYFDPTSTDELQGEYRLVGGQLFFDLWQVEESSEPIEITASVAMGEILVRVPTDAHVEVDAAIGGGDLYVLDRYQSGTNVIDRKVVEGGGHVIRLHLEAGLGSIRVQTFDPEMEEELGL
jgi:phage shock protein PspC (stress-responsive transcriptional regulator)